MIRVMRELHITEKQYWTEMTPYSVRRLLWAMSLEQDVQEAESQSRKSPNVSTGASGFANRARTLSQQQAQDSA